MLTCETRGNALARLGRALADPTRCRILLAVLDGVRYPGELATHLGLTRSNVSNHLTCLRGCGLVVAVHEGRQVRYDLADAHLARALAELSGLVLAVDTDDPCAGGAPEARAVRETGAEPLPLAGEVAS
ncbi:Cd(II)/Pb(II)-sensing metalloregulatory transcriptional regulator CmtR [Saccharomonospora saliphila]|uniref:Cd(II)/Pb(II)-sensing metalloregulatory transcriptional regulator CmtR n=1 Tax=Saccharomonospora saliphila TaxID=369829 RepID=UPI000377F8E9|nr:metalloregulator ArsR/SmtB family transcription factor [Saccharomonospora saliphila]